MYIVCVIVYLTILLLLLHIYQPVLYSSVSIQLLHYCLYAIDYVHLPTKLLAVLWDGCG